MLRTAYAWSYAHLASTKHSYEESIEKTFALDKLKVSCGLDNLLIDYYVYPPAGQEVAPMISRIIPE